MRSLWKLPALVFPKSFQEVITVASKTEYSVQLVIGLCFHSSTALTLTTKSCSWPCFRGSPVWSARDEFSVSDCDKYIERKPALMGTHCMFTLMGKSGRFFFFEVSSMEKRGTLNVNVIILRVYPWRSRCAKECATCIPNAPTHRS